MLPELPILTRRLSAAFEGNASFPAPLAVTHRSLPFIMSTFPNETVTCRFANGRRRRLFIKYEAGKNHHSFGHRGGISYEAEVYRELLRKYPGFKPKCLGADIDASTGEAWLFLEFLDRCVRVSDIEIEETEHPPMLQSARWIARFHSGHESFAANHPPSFLKRYDASYYRGWARRTSKLTRPLHSAYPWLPELCKKEILWINLLLQATPTLIHGEFYSKTLLFRDNTIFPVDWESAALAAGEIDLAALIEGPHWPENVVKRCVEEYQRTRWPNLLPSKFQQTLDAAHLYLHFRWLGERQDWTLQKKDEWRYAHLRATGERLGLI